MKKDTPKPQQRSLQGFLSLQRQKDCPVCQLPPKALAQLIGRNRHKFPVAMVVEWLRVEWGITITKNQFMTHARAAHDLNRARAKRR